MTGNVWTDKVHGKPSVGTCAAPTTAKESAAEKEKANKADAAVNRDMTYSEYLAMTDSCR